MESPAPAVVVFKPPLPLRIALSVIGAGCLVGVFGQLRALFATGAPLHAVGAIMMSLPAVLAAAATRRQVRVEADGMHSTSLLRSKWVRWSDVKRIDQARSSFTVETASGPISAGWLAASERDRLLRLIIERGRLTASMEQLPYGVRARYIPRAKPLEMGEFRPHNKRG